MQRRQSNETRGQVGRRRQRAPARAAHRVASARLAAGQRHKRHKAARLALAELPLWEQTFSAAHREQFPPCQLFLAQACASLGARRQHPKSEPREPEAGFWDWAARRQLER